jgi:hypothetical protein
MLIVLFCVLLSILLLGMAAIEEGLDLFICFNGFFIIFIIWILPCIGYLNSFNSYLDIKATYTTVVDQYRNSIKMYEDKAIIHVSDKSFTDFKYNGYQDNIASLIKDLRNKVEKYNKIYIAKQG